MRWKYQKLILCIYDPDSADASKRNHTLWTVNVPAISGDIIAKIHKATVFQGCFVLDTPFIIPRPKQSFPSKENYISLCSPQNSDLSVKWSACFPTTAVLLSNFGTFYKNDGFKTYIEIKVPSDALTQGLNNNVTNVTLTENGIIVLINGTFYKQEANNFFKLEAEHKLPESEITGIHSRYWCSSVYPVQSGKQLSTLAAWTPTEVYLGYNETFNKIGDTANVVKFLNFPNAASLYIEPVSYDSVPSEITLLLICSGCSSSRLFVLAVYNADIWGLRNLYLPVPCSSVMSMIYINAALSSGLLWDDVAFTTPAKTTQIMDIFKYLDESFLYQRCLMGALFTRLFLVSYFYVGCSPGRHIVVERPVDVVCEKRSFTTYKIPGKFLWNPTDEDQIGCYDWDKYRCLMELHYEEYFQPVISFKNSTLDKIWGPQNYRSCFVFHQNSTKEGLQEQYQILNSTLNNYIVWATSHRAIYVFRVRYI
ncbi:LOW QUALITY PROTEIN: cation channel sperm-associated auxiliary subunit epsilon [Ciconia maguari]